MNAMNRTLKVAVLLVAVFVCTFLGVYFYASSGGGRIDMAAKAARTLSLANPAFIQSASTTFLDEEAGISIYTNIGHSLDLSKAKAKFKTIEKETAEYIIGSLSLPDLPESDDVHCFVHKNGWIVVYYLKAEPTSKIIDWNWYLAGKLTKTKLQIGLQEMCSALGVTPTDINYYHFQYPYAYKLMISIDWQEGSGTDSFNIKIPSEFTFYERSWSHRGGDGTATSCGLLTAVQLSPDTFHTVDARVYIAGYPSYARLSYFNLDGEQISLIDGASISEVGIVLVYRET